MQVGALTLNEENREVIKDNLSIQLTNREFELLRFFMEHPDQTLSLDGILARVWGGGYNDSRTVKVNVHRLRGKLEEIGTEDLIETVWGVGYRFTLGS